jgi:putative SOS response-associated peptidase YedK
VENSTATHADRRGAWARQSRYLARIMTVHNPTRPLHDRVPVILHEKDYHHRVDPTSQEPMKLAPLLLPYREEDLTAYPISMWVNSPRDQGPQCIEPLSASG